MWTGVGRRRRGGATARGCNRARRLAAAGGRGMADACDRMSTQLVRHGLQEHAFRLFHYTLVLYIHAVAFFSLYTGGAARRSARSCVCVCAPVKYACVTVCRRLDVGSVRA